MMCLVVRAKVYNVFGGEGQGIYCARVVRAGYVMCARGEGGVYNVHAW